MKYVLVIVENPNPTAPGGMQALRNFATSFRQVSPQIPPAAMLNEGAFLLPLSNGLSDLSNLVAEAKLRGLRLHTLFFEEEPQFVISPPKT